MSSVDDRSHAATAAPPIGVPGPPAHWRAPLRCLDDILRSRSNNFDLLRIAAALLVLWSHSYFESPDDSPYGLLQGLLDFVANAGPISVYAFFLISGMLISASMEKHRAITAFLIARVARLWPGFIVCSAVILVAIIPLASGGSLANHAYFKAVHACLRANALFFASGGCGQIDGAFPSSPMPGSFGFTFWTLAAEVHCYGMVLALGLVLRRRLTAGPLRTALFCGGTLAFLAGFLLIARSATDASRFAPEFTVLGGYETYPVVFFITGMLLYAARRWVVVDGRAALAALALGFVLPSWTHLLYPAFVYGVLALAGTPWLRGLKPRHDLSYGVYIYGVAVQQAVVSVTGIRPIPVNFLLSAPLALGLAFLSWRFVEAPAIGFGRRLIRRVEGRSEAAR